MGDLYEAADEFRFYIERWPIYPRVGHQLGMRQCGSDEKLSLRLRFLRNFNSGWKGVDKALVEQRWIVYKWFPEMSAADIISLKKKSKSRSLRETIVIALQLRCARPSAITYCLQQEKNNSIKRSIYICLKLRSYFRCQIIQANSSTHYGIIDSTDFSLLRLFEISALRRLFNLLNCHFKCTCKQITITIPIVIYMIRKKLTHSGGKLFKFTTRGAALIANLNISTFPLVNCDTR